MGCKHLLSLPWMTFSIKGEQTSWSREKTRSPENAFPPLCLHKNRQWSLLGTTALMSPSTNSLRHHLEHSEDSAQIQSSSSVPSTFQNITFLSGSGWKDVPKTAMNWGAEALAPQISGRAPHSHSVAHSISSNTPIQLYWATASQSTNHSDKPLQGYLFPILLLPAGF